jgi:hypothetical protein
VDKAVGLACAEIIWTRGNHAAKEVEIGDFRDDRSRSSGRSASLWAKRAANNVARIRFRATSMTACDSAILILRSAAVRPVRRSPKGEGGSIPRSAWICITAWCCSDVLRLACLPAGRSGRHSRAPCQNENTRQGPSNSHFGGAPICNRLASLENTDVSRSFRVQSRLQAGAPQSK